MRQPANLRATHALAPIWSLGAATLLVVTGLLLLWAGAEDGPLWQRADAVFGVSTRTLLRVGGGAHLLLAAWFAFVRSPHGLALPALWLGLNYTVYRVGLTWLGVKSPPMLECVADVIRLRARTLDMAWTGLTVYLLVGGVLVLVGHWRQRQRAEAEAFLEQYRRQREQGGDGSVKPVAERPSTRGDEP